MTPTLFGRIQTRIFLVVFVGVPWTLLIGPLLPVDAPLSDVYRITLRALAIVLVLGVFVFEPIYHFLQQFRWEKDWPAMFVLLEAIPEGIAVRLALPAVVDLPIPEASFWIHFGTTWLVLFLFVHGPIRVLFLRWRFRGGRII